MIKESKWKQFGYERTENIEFIVIHNTSSELSASELFNWLNDECKTSNGCHYLVDDVATIEVMPLTWSVYHTGKGLDYGNRKGIAIEICSNINNAKYLKGEKRAMRLVKELMKEYGLTKNDIYYHNDFNKTTHCPNDIMNRYASKKDFIDAYIN